MIDRTRQTFRTMFSREFRVRPSGDSRRLVLAGRVRVNRTKPSPLKGAGFGGAAKYALPIEAGGSGWGWRTRTCRGGSAPAHSREAGFSLLELLVVLAILALLAGLVAPRVIGYLGGAKTETAKLQLRNIESALDLYRLDMGKYPAALDGLVTQPAGEERWRGPYLKKATGLTDPWGEPFKYRIPGQHGEYDLFSLGADKAEGGDGEDRDVRSW